MVNVVDATVTDRRAVRQQYAVRFIDKNGTVLGVLRYIDRKATEDVGFIPPEATQMVIQDAAFPDEKTRYAIYRDEASMRTARRNGVREHRPPPLGDRVWIFEG